METALCIIICYSFLFAQISICRVQSVEVLPPVFLSQRSLRDNMHDKSRGYKTLELLNDAESCVRVHAYLCVCAILKTMSHSSCTTAPISWWTVSPMCRSRTQQLRTIKTHSQRPAPYRNMHEARAHSTYARAQFTDAWVFAQMHSRSISIHCRFCRKQSMEVDSFVSHVHRFYTHRRAHSAVCDRAKCFVSLLSSPFITVMVLLWFLHYVM